MAIRQTPIHFVTWLIAAAALASFLQGCDRSAAELATLKVENERLRKEIVNLRQNANGAKEPGASAGKPDMILEINELWKQRFEDNEFRAKQRLSDKTLRVTGILDAISSDSMSIYGLGKSRNVRMGVALEKLYAAKVQDGIAALEKGVSVTVQGKFAYDRMELTDATIVDKASGNPMTAEQLQAFGQIGPDGTPPPAPLPENQ
jgi:hypothetical protein